MIRPQQVLSFPSLYRLFGYLVGGKCRARYARDYLKVRPGERVLDLGCGPGDLLGYIPECDYVGVDIDAGYIRSARERFGSRGAFHCMPVEDFVVANPASFDLVMANGVIHHLDDEQAGALLRIAAQALKPNGRLVTLDGCFVEGQSWVSKKLLESDRGKFVRRQPEYVALAQSYFGDVVADLRHDMLNLPYTHLIMTCRK